MPGSPLASFNGRPQTMTLWDPDGPGPLEEWLVVGGGFSIELAVPEEEWVEEHA